MSYSKLFNNTAVLTSKNPEVFLTLTWNTSGQYWIIPDISTVIDRKVLYINGLDANDYTGTPSLGYALELNSSNNVASFHIYTPVNYNFTERLYFKIYNSDTLSTIINYELINIKNRPYIVENNIINTFTNDNILIDDEASYMILRTNPKYTGNIVLYVDSSENMYLDTFKISDVLSNKKYRKQQISGNSVLSSDIRNTFSSLPLGELYRVDSDNTLLIDIPKTSIEDQYITTYNYGAKLLKDELYAEDNGILAPLWINSKLPDYFAAFRLSGVYNTETYDGSNLDNLAFKYLEESDLIKTWSLKPEAPLGQYLETHTADIVKIKSPLFLSLTDPSANESDPNTWYGIAVDKGVVTGRSETTHFFNQKAQNYTDLNAFVSQGFERNTLLIPNLINLEYIFTDEDVSLYSMNRYFGLYLTENVLYKIGYYLNSSSGTIEIISLDGTDSSVFMHSLIFNASTGNVASDYMNRIFVLNDNIQLQRITNVNQINEASINDYVNKPYQNIFITEAEQISYNPFMILTLNNTLEQGEHLRIINKTQNKIWEVYSVDASNFNCNRYCSISEDPSGLYPIVYRTYFDITGDISYQIQEIEAAFDLFSDFEGTQFRAGIHGDNWVSLILNDDASTNEEWLFQRITSSTLSDPNDSSSAFNSIETAGYISFFGRFTPNSSDFETITYDSSYGPIDFELFGDRNSIMINFINNETNYLYTMDSSDNIIDKFEDPTLYQGNSGWYKKILEFEVSTNLYQYIKDPLSIKDKILIMTSEEIQLIENQFNAYNLYPINISLMGINSVKDIDYTVYDISLGVKNKYKYNREDDVSSYNIFIEHDASYSLSIKGSYIIQSGTGNKIQYGITSSYTTNSLINTFDSSIKFLADTDTIVTYAVLDGSYNYQGYKDGSAGNEENICDYYDSSVLLKYGLTTPLISKWVGLGNDCRNNPIRLILDSSILNVNTNFIPDDNNFTQELTYPSFKYLTPGNRAWEDYVFYDINDVIYDADASLYLTFKESMFRYPYVDYFSKLVYSNYNVDATKSRSSIVYYNQYKDTIDVIFMGLNLSIKVENLAKNVLDIKNYDRYKFSFISTTQRNKDSNRPIEFIINENIKTILMIWYQGNDELNYNARYSTFLPGKSLMNYTGEGFVSTSNSSDHYSFVKTPYFVNNSTIQKTIENFYGTATTYNSATANPYAQFNKNLGEFSSTWNAFNTSTNIIATNIFYIPSDENYQTFSQYIDYIYARNATTYGDYVLNYGYRYRSKVNYYDNNTTNLATLKYYLATAHTYIMYYIIRENEIINSLDFGSVVNPMSITINAPRIYGSISTYNGWFKPDFNNILEFKTNEESDLISIVNKDFTLSNTNLRTYNNIPQLWYNNVVSTVSAADIAAGNAISYISNFNVFKALWDADYYIKDNAYVNGYLSSQELSSFFGSKLPKLSNEITLEKWDSTMVSSLQETTTITLSFNITRAILSLFKTNSTFLSNWANFGDSDSTIDAYVKNTILTYYNISQPKIKVNFYYKSRDTLLLHYTNDGGFKNDGKQNFNGQLIYQNDEYIYKIIVSKAGNFSYFISFTLTEK